MPTVATTLPHLLVHNVRGRFLTMFGMFATTTPRNDPSVSRGQWDLANAYGMFPKHGEGITGMSRMASISMVAFLFLTSGC
jgi:hypothetical protein